MSVSWILRGLRQKLRASTFALSKIHFFKAGQRVFHSYSGCIPNHGCIGTAIQLSRCLPSIAQYAFVGDMHPSMGMLFFKNLAMANHQTLLWFESFHFRIQDAFKCMEPYFYQDKHVASAKYHMWHEEAFENIPLFVRCVSKFMRIHAGFLLSFILRQPNREDEVINVCRMIHGTDPELISHSASYVLQALYEERFMNAVQVLRHIFAWNREHATEALTAMLQQKHRASKRFHLVDAVNFLVDDFHLTIEDLDTALLTASRRGRKCGRRFRRHMELRRYPRRLPPPMH